MSLAAAPASPRHRRTLNAGEKTKLFLFLGLLFVIGNLLLADKYLQTRKDLLLRFSHLQDAQAESGRWLAQDALWTKRSAWVAAKQPRPEADKQSDVLLLEALQKSASENHITIVDQSLKESTATPFYRGVSVQLRVSGSLEAFCRWLAAVQQPSLFQAVSDFSMKGGDEKDPGKVTANLTVSRLYSLIAAPKTPSAPVTPATP